MRLVGQLLTAAAAMAVANGGCDRHTQLTPSAIAAEADASARKCAQQVIDLITIAFGTTIVPKSKPST